MQKPHMTESDGIILDFFCKHLIAIGFNALIEMESGEAEQQTALYSGTYIQIDGNFYLLTAGHCTQNISQALSSNYLLNHTMYILDSFSGSTPNHHAIPFDYRAEEVIQVYEPNGWDYALIPLRPNYQRLLAANKIQPLTENLWPRQGAIEFDHLALLGLPEEYVSNNYFLAGEIVTTSGPTMAFLDSCEPAAENDNQMTAIVRESTDLISILGMSGGPIVGVNVQSNQVRYWIAGIQSRWNPDTRQIFGNRVASIVEHFRQSFEH